MPLTDTAIRQLKTPEKTRKVADEKALYLELSPAGGKLWRLKYRIHGKEKRIGFGAYPEVSLRQARERRDEARRLLAEGIDPSAHRKAAKRTAVSQLKDDFESIAREWFAKKSATWADSHKDRLLRRLERDVFPALGGRPVSQITAPELLNVMRKVEDRSIDTAHRALRTCGQVFRYAMHSGRCAADPSGHLSEALASIPKGHFAATLEPTRIGQILVAMDSYRGTAVVVAALRLAPLLFVRPGELRRAKWSQFDLDTAIWEYISSKTKQPHVVPLSTQAVAILRELHQVTGRDEYAFPGARSSKRPMSENAVLAALRALGVGKDELVPHAFRAIARTFLDETLGFRPDIIELQLAHNVRDALGRSYNRTTHLQERHRMMQAWADHLDTLKARAVPPA